MKKSLVPPAFRKMIEEFNQRFSGNQVELPLGMVWISFALPPVPLQIVGNFSLFHTGRAASQG